MQKPFHTRRHILNKEGCPSCFETSSLGGGLMEPIRGVDVSEFNGNLDVEALKRAGIEYVIIRCGYGNDSESQDDVQYRNNVKKCEQAGMPYGVYLYAYAKTAGAAKSEADHTLRLLKEANPSYGVWYDVEDSALPSGSALIDNCLTYCKAIEAAGYYCGIYTSLYFWENRLNDTQLNTYDKWVAHWADAVGYDGDYGIWQYSDNGLIDGKRFDMNLAYRDYPALTRGEDAGMTKEEIAALARSEAQKVYEENERKYKTIASVPQWVREDVLKVYEELQLSGTGEGLDGENTEINASHTYIRLIKVISELLKKLSEQMNGHLSKDG